MKDIKEITKQLEDGVKGVYTSEKWMNYLAFMGKFHQYSINNSLLIWLQNPKASYVAGYQTWAKKLNRQVRKGEKGITILAPCPHKITKEVVDQDGNLTEKEINFTTFRTATVFDISQTDGDAIPEICEELAGEIDGYEKLYNQLCAVSPVPVEFEDIQNGASGYFNTVSKVIRIKEGMSQMQTVKTLIHEIAHSILHDRETGEEKEAGRSEKEVQAESVAFVVCSMLGIQTDDYSFEYIASWSKGKEAKELTASMEVIRKTANQIYDGLTAA